MADVQKENGYTGIANQILDALIATQISGQELRIALLIIRKTYGFNKKEDAISLSQMTDATGMHKIRCSQVVRRLELMKILTVTENINGIGKKYRFNKDFETWATVTENINRYRKVKQTVNVLRKRPLMKTLTTKDNNTKDNNTKDKASLFSIPEWTPKETFFEYLEMRKRIKRPLMEKSYPRFFSALLKLCAGKQSLAEEIINQSILNSWQGIFPLKGDDNGNRRSVGGLGKPKEWKPDRPPERIESGRVKELLKTTIFKNQAEDGQDYPTV